MIDTERERERDNEIDNDRYMIDKRPVVGK